MNAMNVGKYTFVIEWLFPDYEMSLSTVYFDSVGGITIHKTSGRKFGNRYENHSRYLVWVEKSSTASPPEYLYCTIHINENETYHAKYKVPCVVYGVVGEHTDVLSSVYDFLEAYEIINEKMQMETDLNLNGHRLENSIHYLHGILVTGLQ